MQIERNESEMPMYIGSKSPRLTKNRYSRSEAPVGELREEQRLPVLLKMICDYRRQVDAFRQNSRVEDEFSKESLVSILDSAVAEEEFATEHSVHRADQCIAIEAKTDTRMGSSVLLPQSWPSEPAAIITARGVWVVLG
jgi:hypothetical protein